jgi:hypothetical protein
VGGTQPVGNEQSMLDNWRSEQTAPMQELHTTTHTVSIKNKLPTPAARIAFGTLPPELQTRLKRLGFKCGRIEPSGSLTMLLSNGLSLTERQTAITGFRGAAKDYGLDLQRVSMMGEPGSLWDDGCLLVGEADRLGMRPRLFNEDGSPSQDVLLEGGATQHATQAATEKAQNRSSNRSPRA